MIRRQYFSATSDAFPFRITVDGSYQALGAYSVDFQGRSNTSAVSYHLSAASAGATIISVPYTALVAGGQVSKGRFFIVGSDGEPEHSEPVHITVR
jgi:hypothetical protein